MRIGLITPAPPRSRYGNRVTALRWARILRSLGHRVIVATSYEGEAYDVMVALHARRSYEALARYRRERPNHPLVLCLTGTDLYQDLQTSAQARESIGLADRLVVLQPKAVEDLEPRLHPKVRVIYQSIAMPWLESVTTDGEVAGTSRPGRRAGAKRFDVVVIGHLREVKDPFRTALAARLLPTSSGIRVTQIGGELEDGFADQARAEMAVNPRYRWVGETPRWRVFRMLAQSQLMVLSSRLEGGANVLSEAIVAGVPALASRIAGSIGLLGEDYPGYFPVGDTEALCRMLSRAEMDPPFLADLRDRCARRAPLFTPAAESAAWASLLAELRP